jgi:Na+/H+ antiporter NhaD/arsenite permease-like protein
MNLLLLLSSRKKSFLLAALAFTALSVVAFSGAAQGRDRPYDQSASQPQSQAVSHPTPTQPSEAQNDLGSRLPLWSCLPFVGVLLSIALVPMFAPIFWHHHVVKVSFAWALCFAIPFIIFFRGEASHELLKVVLCDYVPFLILLWGLFSISGGIYLRGTLVGKPLVNTLILLIGTVLASWMGTTGAAMLLIRPLIRANKSRRYKTHTVIFFIFLVANIGGVLTPLGDPPLFLGFLHGVPFFWTFSLFPQLLLAMALLLAIYFVVDMILYRREGHATEPSQEGRERLSLRGSHNFILLVGVMAAVLMSASWKIGDYRLLGIEFTYQSTLRDLLIVALGIVSIYTTRAEHRDANGFSWAPIKEVAYLFIGIFVTITGPLAILQAGPSGAAAPLISAVTSPAHYYWASGMLSSFLDNAPTYLTFFNLALGKLAINPTDVTAILTHQLNHPASAQFIRDLAAVSVGSVFFGANTYIGNAPNFMVRSIAEAAKVPMPSFFGYCLWSGGILIPVFTLIMFIFSV